MKGFHNGVTGEFLYPCLKMVPDITRLDFSHSNLSAFDAKAIGKVLADFHNIRELNISHCNLSVTTAKDIADGLMRAKKLEVLKIRGNYSMGTGLNSIVYNLAFSPKLRFLDVFQCVNANADYAEALQKLLQISGAIEVLNIGHTNVFAHLKEAFYMALGQSKSLIYLNMDHSATCNTYPQLAKAIAMNAKLSGSLKIVSLEKWFQSSATFKAFLAGMMVSNYDHEMWYGDKKAAAKMEKEDLDRHFHYNLE